MAYTAGYDYDLFVSYARNDDAAQVINGRGWVAEFVERLAGNIAGKLGSDGKKLKLFFDKSELRNNDHLEQLKAAARRSAAFLAVTSRSYADSPWCRDEVAAFVEVDRDNRRLFAVEYLPLRAGQKFGSRLDDLNRLFFWTVNATQSSEPKPLFPDTREYYEHQQHLAGQIAETLRLLDEGAKAGAGIQLQAGPTEEERRAKGVVFLGQTTDDLETERLQVRDALDQAGYWVVPAGDLPGSGEEFRKAVGTHLAGAKLYVQLLSRLAGKRPPDLPEGYLRAQADEAAAAGTDAMFWRRPDIDLATISDRDHLALLNGEEVVSSTLESFKESVRRRLEKPVPRTGEQRTGRREIFFINSDQTDLPAARKIQADLISRKHTSIIAELAGRAGQNREILEEGFTGDNAVVLVFGNASLGWVMSQLRLYWKLNPETRDDKIVALMVGPPENKPAEEELGIGMPELRWIDCRKGWDVEPVLKLVANGRA